MRISQNWEVVANLSRFHTINIHLFVNGKYNFGEIV